MSQVEHTILIVVEDGVIQSIHDIPPGVRVVVKHYDVDGADEAGLRTDENGDHFIEAIWE